MSDVILRVDDFPGTKPAEFWRHNLDSFRRFDDVLCKNGFSEYTLGCIPTHMTPEHLRFFSDNHRITVAMHGINHPEDVSNEFWECSFASILGQIKPVHKMLSLRLGYNIRDYIPPHNDVDQNTINALLCTGFHNLWGGPETDTTTLDFSTIDFRFSEKPMEYGRSDELLQIGAVEHILSSKKKVIYLSLHFPWEVNIGLSNIDDFLKRIDEA